MNKLLFTILLLSTSCFAQAQTDTAIVRRHLDNITQTPGYRNYKNIGQLYAIADYIKGNFSKYSDSVSLQEYSVDSILYKNVACSFGTENQKRIIIGAHYDVCGNQQGADDNASGIAALIELARQLQKQKLHYRVDLVAYTLEEPPFFRTESMGSYIHAKYLHDNKIEVYGMLSVEMIGYFSDEKRSQQYPVGLLSLFYGNKGNYITLVKKMGAGKFARRFCREYKSAGTIRTKKFAAPKSLPGIDFSDHLNYWKFGYSALMITDTSFYRNHNYHQVSDTVLTLDIARMAKTIDGIYRTITSL